MAGFKRICRVCGAEYEACRTRWKPGDGNRWQDVACSPEHGAQYFAAIFASRKDKVKQEPVVAPAEPEVIEDAAAPEADREKSDREPKNTARKRAGSKEDRSDS